MKPGKVALFLASLALLCQFVPVTAQQTVPEQWRGGTTPETKKLEPTAPKIPSGGGGSPESLKMQLPRIVPENEKAKQQLLDIVDQAAKSSGAIFEGENKVLVHAPLLTALITLNKHYDPFDIDTATKRQITLKEVLDTALANNLNIKISWSDMNMARWGYYGSIGGFLPNLANKTSFEAMDGHFVSPGNVIIPLKNHYLNNSDGFEYYLYKGGSIVYGMLEAKHTYKASQFALKGTTYDMLLEATKLYYDLVLQEVLLQIQVKAVEVAKGLVVVQQDMYDKGTNTKLDLLQALYELSDNRQHLIKQQVARRQAAVKLATALNLDPSVDLTSENRTVVKTTLVDDTLLPSDLLAIAVKNRPELKKYENLRLAALDQIKVAQSTLLPQIYAKGSVVTTAAKAQALNLSGQNQQTPLGTGTGVGCAGAVGCGGAPLVAPTTPGVARNTASALFIIGVQANWQVGGLGITEYGQVQSARYNARKVQFEFNRELADIYQQVRDANLSATSSSNLIKETTDAVTYTEEGLRVAEVRMKDGIGTYLDVLTAQKNYTDALISKAKALIQFNIDEATLLHSVGRMSVDTATCLTPIRQ